MKIGVELFCLPPRSPELNDIERVWRSAKYKGCPHRAHISIEAIGTAEDRVLTRQQTRIQGSAVNFTKPLAGCVDHGGSARMARRHRLPGWLGECLRSRPPSEASGSGGRTGGLGVQGTAEPIVGGAEGGFRWAAQFGDELPVVVYAGIRREFTAEPAAEGGGVARSA